jgi:hypothetical protein
MRLVQSFRGIHLQDETMSRHIFEEEHEMFRDSVRAFMQKEVQPNSDRWHEQGIVDREAFLKAGEQGLLLMGRTRNTAVPAFRTSGTSKFSSRRTPATATQASSSRCTAAW